MAGTVVLASSSPRRRDLLERLGFSVKIMPSNIPEEPLSGEMPEHFVKRIAREKVLSVVERIQATLYPEHPTPGTDSSKAPDSNVRWIIGADTIVVLDGHILGKPEDTQEAEAMLTRLSGATHTVITGFCVHDLKKDKEGVQAVKSTVQFKSLRDGEIERYLSMGESMDKAGAYGIQGVGSYLVETLHGSYTNVIGLPLCQVIEMMQEMGADDVLPF